jgi:Na+/phosphate symporter
MERRATLWFLVLALCATFFLFAAGGKLRAQKSDVQTSETSLTDTEKQNLQEYIVLLRENLRQEKGQLLGGMMQFTPADAAKFWPIYDEYDRELNQLNNLRLENMKSYARDYSQMTDEKADQLTRQGFEFQKRRAELLEKYYERVKQALGATTAARFLQVENQLLSIMDLQIESHLPVIGHAA